MSFHSVIICMLHCKKAFVLADSHQQTIHSKLDLPIEEKEHMRWFHEIICLNLDVIFTRSLEQDGLRQTFVCFANSMHSLGQIT